MKINGACEGGGGGGGIHKAHHGVVLGVGGLGLVSTGEPSCVIFVRDTGALSLSVLQARLFGGSQTLTPAVQEGTSLYCAAVRYMT